MSSIGAWPANLRPKSCRMPMSTNQRVNSAPGGGSEQAVDFLNDRWTMSVVVPMRSHTDAAAVEAFDNSFRDQVNWVEVWHFARPEPRGSMRGAPTLSVAANQGAAQLVIQTTAYATLLAGDLIGFAGPILLMVQSDCIADGAGLIAVPLVNRLRVAQVPGAPVIWNKPTGLFRKLASSGIEYLGGGRASEASFELAEKI